MTPPPAEASLMDSTPACVITNGGPLIALPHEVVDAWRGTLPPLGVEVPADWTWGSGDIVCDYDRACDPPEVSLRVNDSFSAWPLEVAGHAALVLDGECSTTVLRWHDGLVVARDIGRMSTREVIASIAGIAEVDWLDTGVALELSSGGLSIFDSAYPGRERQDADGGVLDAMVVPGRYRIWIATPSATKRTTFVRLRGAPQADAPGTAGVTVR